MSSKRPQTDIVPRVGAGCLLVFGVFLLGVAINALIGEDFEALPFTIVLGVGAMTGGFFWLRGVGRTERKLRQQYDEKAILGVASRYDGKVTLAQITLETELDASEAAETIDRLCRQGIARAELLDDGTVTYRFGGLLPGN